MTGAKLARANLPARVTVTSSDALRPWHVVTVELPRRTVYVGESLGAVARWLVRYGYTPIGSEYMRPAANA